MSLQETGIVLREQISDKWYVMEPFPTGKYFLLLSVAVFSSSVDFAHQSLCCGWKEVVFVTQVDVKTAALCSQYIFKSFRNVLLFFSEVKNTFNTKELIL